jgi:hypothetical protein
MRESWIADSKVAMEGILRLTKRSLGVSSDVDSIDDDSIERASRHPQSHPLAALPRLNQSLLFSSRQPPFSLGVWSIATGGMALQYAAGGATATLTVIGLCMNASTIPDNAC